MSSRPSAKPTRKRPSARPKRTKSDNKLAKTATGTTATSAAVHPTAAGGFLDGDLYERGRASYPEAVLGPLDVRPRTRVVDVGCGTGKLTRQLLTASDNVVGVDPLPSMVATFRQRCPDVSLVTGLAEALPFPSGAFDLVTCASAFHWFDHTRAIPEIHRILGRGGRLAILWNRRDELTGWAAEFWAITEAHRRDTPGYRTGEWRAALESSGLFGPIEEHWFEHVQRVDLDGLLARIGSISFIETLPRDEKDAVFDEARRFIASHPETRELETFELPYRSVVYVTSRIDV